MRQKTLWTNAKGPYRQMTAPLARDQYGSAETHLCHWLRGTHDAVNGSEADSLPETSAPVSQPRVSSVSTRPGCTATAMSHCVLSHALKRVCHSFAASRVASFEFAYPLKPAGRRR